MIGLEVLGDWRRQSPETRQVYDHELGREAGAPPTLALAGSPLPKEYKWPPKLNGYTLLRKED